MGQCGRQSGQDGLQADHLHRTVLKGNEINTARAPEAASLFPCPCFLLCRVGSLRSDRGSGRSRCKQTEFILNKKKPHRSAVTQPHVTTLGDVFSLCLRWTEDDVTDSGSELLS